MRPASRGTSGMPGTSGGPPGTGMRPGSGKRTNLRTGMASTGPGTQAAQGVSISSNVNVYDRPMTGQGVSGMRTQGQGQSRQVQDASYYIGILRKKITDITSETTRLNSELDQQSKDNQQYSTLEKKYDQLLKTKEKLEGELADYNLALDKTRTSTDPDDVEQMVIHLTEKNKVTSRELDGIFMQRKQRENELQQTETQLENHYKAIQTRISELEPGKLRAYNDLLNKQKDLQSHIANSESKLNE
eukprot:gene12566-26462_t